MEDNSRISGYQFISTSHNNSYLRRIKKCNFYSVFKCEVIITSVLQTGCKDGYIHKPLLRIKLHASLDFTPRNPLLCKGEFVPVLN